MCWIVQYILCFSGPPGIMAAEEVTTTTKKYESAPDEMDADLPEPPLKKTHYDYFVADSVKDLHDELYRQVFAAILANGTFFNTDAERRKPPFVFMDPKEITKDINLDFKLPEHRVNHSELVAVINKIFEYSPKASHPFKVDRHGGAGSVFKLFSKCIFHENPIFLLYFLCMIWFG